MVAEAGKLVLRDVRKVFFDRDAVLEVVLTFDREQGGWFHRGSGFELSVEPEGAGAVTLTVQRPQDDQRETVHRAPSWVAGAMVFFCWRSHIPLPRRGRKSLEPDEHGITLVIESDITVIRSYTKPPARITETAARGVPAKVG